MISYSIFTTRIFLHLRFSLWLWVLGVSVAHAQSPSQPRSPVRPRDPVHPVGAVPAKPTKTMVPAQVSVSSPNTLFRDANHFYNQGQYRDAAQLFQQLIVASSWANFAVFYNLGNCYVRLQEYGRALAYYRKAQRLRPNHLDLLHNIQLVYRKLGKTEPLQDELRLKFLFWYYLLSLEQIFYAVVLLTSLCLLMWSVHLRRNSRGLSGLRWPTAAVATLTLVLWLSLGIKIYHERYLHYAVITQNLVTARSGYGDQFEPMFRLTEADQVIVLESLDVKTPAGTQTWLRVEASVLEKDNKTHTRKIGWIPAATVQIL